MVETLSFGLFGKVPFAEDFVRAGKKSTVFSKFDEWLVSSIERAHGMGDAWRRAFPVGAPQAFVFRQPGADFGAPLLVGALAPSSDRAGRMFPLAVATPFCADDYLTARPELLPIVLEPVWQQASALVTTACAASEANFQERVVSSGAAPASIADAARTYEAWTAQLPPSELWALLYSAEGDQSALPENVPLYSLRVLNEAVRPMRGVEQPTTPLSAWLPLGRAGGAAVCFWLDLVKRLANWRRTIASFFWSHDGASGKMLVHLGEPPRSTAAELWLPSQKRDEFFDLTIPRPDADLSTLPDLSPELARSARSARTLADLLSAARAE